MLSHYREGHRRTRSLQLLFTRYTVLDFLAEVFGELQGAVEHALEHLTRP